MNANGIELVRWIFSSRPRCPVCGEWSGVQHRTTKGRTEYLRCSPCDHPFKQLALAVEIETSNGTALIDPSSLQEPATFTPTTPCATVTLQEHSP